MTTLLEPPAVHEIMVVDDERLDIGHVVEQLERWGFRVRVVDGPAEAIEMLERGEVFAGVVVDLMFRSSDAKEGLMLVKRLRTGFPGLSRAVGIIVYTNAPVDQLKVAIEAGASTFVSKDEGQQRMNTEMQRVFLGETELSRDLCEVVEIDYENQEATIEMEWRGRRLQKDVPMGVVPEMSRRVGGAFDLVACRRYRGATEEVVIRGEALPTREDPEWEHIIEELGKYDNRD